ncbi:MAG: hypothetical protein PHC85_01290 [Candidatus Pacebacteria bacterium]|nr:hypothetical protein [Candidatus Paceibacterota bacterium]
MEIIPAINAESFEEVKRQIKLIEPYSEWAQIDVCDGTFTQNIIWHNPKDLADIKTPLKLEAHLMINDIDQKVEDWLIEPISRIIFQLETAKDPFLVADKCRKAGKEVGIAIAPDTAWTRLVPFYEKVDIFQILSVRAGLAGQTFLEESLDKIIHIKENCPSAIIEVDGGIDKEAAKKAAEAGADILVTASYIFSAKDIGMAVEELKNA